MRILVLQLARFGDIYQTWPVLRALKRQGAEVHLLVRERFQAATMGLEGVTVHCLPTAEILEPICGSGDEHHALTRLMAVLAPLRAAGFDKIINLSFSPASSFLTDILSEEGATVCGYTRHSDGYLCIPDDSSAYFYAQVGIGRPNRYHLTDVFAAVSDVSLEPCDFQHTDFDKSERIVVHLGASQVEKAYPPELWVEVLKALSGRYLGEIVLVGSSEERAMAETVAAQAAQLGVRNLAGQTSLPELFKVIGSARLLIGADSAPIHIAAMTGTPVLNLSSSAVNFWETGPLTSGSRVLFNREITALRPERIANQALSMLDAVPSEEPHMERTASGYISHGLETSNEFSWQLVQALYTGTPYPKAPNPAAEIAFQRLFELADLALMQLARWDAGSAAAAQILSSVDQLLEEIPRLNDDVAPVVRWFQTQRLRLAPAANDETLAATRKLFEELLWIAAVYHHSENNPSEAIELCTRLAPQLREFEFHDGDFQALVARLQELARHSTKVGGRSWSSVLSGMQEALARRDYIELADQLEFELKPQLQSSSTGVIL